MKNLHDESIMWGTHASVKNIDNKICQKVYEEYTMTTIKDHVIDEWVFNTIKSLDLESLVKLYDYVFNTIRGQITSYTMEYYEPFIEDILNIDTYYIIDSFIKIYRDVIILSENSILIGDMNFSNIIFGKNGIKVIDFDNYKKSTLSRNKLIELNKEELCRCFKGAYRNALYNILITKYIPNSIGKMMDLFNPDVDNLPSHVTKKLVKHPNLLHFFEDRNV